MKHGRSEYQNGCCRCDICVTAAQDYQRKTYDRYLEASHANKERRRRAADEAFGPPPSSPARERGK